MNELIALAMVAVGALAAIYIYLSGKSEGVKLLSGGPIYSTSKAPQGPVQVDPPVETTPKNIKAIQETIQAPQKSPEAVEQIQLQTSKKEAEIVQAQASDPITSDPPKMQTEEAKAETKSSHPRRKSTRRRAKATK
ncbi:MAG: hypothetical protein ACUVQ8_07485 [Nitrososphaeria archaeon]